VLVDGDMASAVVAGVLWVLFVLGIAVAVQAAVVRLMDARGRRRGGEVDEDGDAARVREEHARALAAISARFDAAVRARRGRRMERLTA
jgi:hypothetical protein